MISESNVVRQTTMIPATAKIASKPGAVLVVFVVDLVTYVAEPGASSIVPINVANNIIFI